MGRTTGWALGAKIRLAMWATAPRASIPISSGTVLLGALAVLPRIIRVYAAVMITEAAIRRPSSVRLLALKVRRIAFLSASSRAVTDMGASLPGPVAATVEPGSRTGQGYDDPEMGMLP